MNNLISEEACSMTQEASMKQRRKHTRIVLQLDAELILFDNTSFRGKTKDISFSGIYIKCNNAEGIPIGDKCTIKLHLRSGENPEIIQCACAVVRTSASGVGIKFISIDLTGYQQFKKLMIYNSSDSDKLMAELEKNPGLDIV